MPFENELCDLLDFTGANARRADPKAAPGAIHKCADGLQVQVPTPLRYIMSVTDAVSELRTAATDFAYFRHRQDSPDVSKL